MFLCLFLKDNCRHSNAALVAVFVLATLGGVVRRAMTAFVLAANFAGVYDDDMVVITVTTLLH
jgi:hypothetical protein